MQQSISLRELITLDGDGVLLRGTFHQPSGPASELVAADVRGRIGIVFLNSLSLPRAASGDSAVYWADSFADYGYPSFRFDLPGLGDTAGEIPAELLNFINGGGYAQIIASKMRELVARFGLSGVLLAGHCAGAVSAIQAAVLCKAECPGLILLDPYFHLPLAIRPAMRRHLSDWALKSQMGNWLSDFYHRVKEIGLSLRGEALPTNANRALLRCWKEVAPSKPVLIFKAPARKASGTGPRPGEFDYLKYILQIAGSRSQVSVELIEGTDHSFANRKGRLAVRLVTERWLREFFPLVQQDEGRVSALRNGGFQREKNSRTQVHCLEG